MTFIKTFIKRSLFVFGALALAITVFLFGMRFADGPWIVVSGGPFTTGTVVSEEPDWSFVKDRQEVEFQLLEPESSRITWIVEHNGRIFIPSGYMTTWWGKIWKQWPIHALEDGRAILRVDGKLYPRQLVRIEDDPDMPYILSELARKYPLGPQDREFSFEEAYPIVSSGYLWIFELTPR